MSDDDIFDHQGGLEIEGGCAAPKLQRAVASDSLDQFFPARSTDLPPAADQYQHGIWSPPPSLSSSPAHFFYASPPHDFQPLPEVFFQVSQPICPQLHRDSNGDFAINFDQPIASPSTASTSLSGSTSSPLNQSTSPQSTPQSSSSTQSSSSPSTESSTSNESSPVSQSSSDTSPGLRVSLDSFDVLRLVGVGAFGRVYQVQHKESKQVYAMKVLKKGLLARKKSVAATRTERDILRRIRHPFFVSLHYAFQDHGRVYLVMDWMGGGPLFAHLKREAMFGEDQAKIYLAQLVLALEHLHGQDIIHRDLKPENILLNPFGNIAITDFGLSKDKFTDSCRTSSYCGTLEYMAPEMIKGEKYGKAADWWSVGALMYDMLCGHPPFRDGNPERLGHKICQERIKFPSFLTGEAVSLIKGLCERNVDKRLGANIKKIKSHRFFRGLNWDDLIRGKIVPPFVPKLSSPLDTSLFEEEYTAIVGMSQSPDDHHQLSASQERCFQGFSYIRSPVLR